ncbi:MAG TPA: ATP-grasp domain-containing protein [Caulifigura sp.]|nr:ATP-grasp domain-containing protein [Caulifigura sp.]
MNIAILAYLEAGESKPDIVMEQVQRALESAGHKATVLTIHDDIVEIVEKVRSAKPELVFNLVESFDNDMIGGSMGVAGVLDLLQIPYTGGGPGELYLQEDKSLSKKLLDYEEVRYPDFASFAPNADFETGGNLRMPLFVKPQRMEASQGIDEKSLVRTTTELMERVLKIHKTLGDAALAEEYIEGRELYVGVLGNSELTAFPPIELDFSGLPEGSPRVADSAAKWDETSERYKGTKSILASLPPELTAKVQKTAIDAARAVRVRDYGRVDLRLTDTGEIFVIEVNASCYLEENSEFAVAARADGVEYPALVNKIADLALERWKQRKRPRKRRR